MPVTAELHHLWDRALTLLEREFGSPTIERFIKPLVPVAMADDTVVLAAPNEFTRDYIRPRYRNPICRALSQAASRPMRLELVVPENDQQAATLAPSPVQPARPAPSPDEAGHLNPKYTFDTFVVGNCNRFAHAACQAVAQSPGRVYNPLFIYGGVGLGKTHLMHAIGHAVTANFPRLRVLYISTEAFSNHLIDAIRDATTAQFRSRYRAVDVLLIDDIQFLAGKERTQEEFFHTFNTLYEASKQIVISSDRPPRDIPTLEERLRSRFEWGLTSDIQPPDLETRVAILRKKALIEGFSVPNEVMLYIATQIETNIRQLEGALIRTVAFASLNSLPITISLVQTVLRDLSPPERPQKITPKTIQEVVAEYYGLRPADLTAKKRTHAVAFPRQVAMYLCRELTDLSLPRIGEEFGGRDHTTVLHACDKVSRQLKEDPDLADTVAALTERLRSQTLSARYPQDSGGEAGDNGQTSSPASPPVDK
ncbi:MAG: chromosomal replication initiator protein DnaA [Firmicutes bacterium]|nr:chromosomal replication initiator protein DnaA [Bacillota bacterium]